MDDIPSPVLTGVLPFGYDYIILETYRGCINRCHYCAWSNKQHRLFSLERILAELDLLISAQVPYVYIIDPIFGPGKTRANKILDFILKKRDEGCPLPGFFVFPNVDYFDDSLSLKLSNANCNVSFGLQTTNKTTLFKANRRQDLVSFASTVRRANKHFARYDVDLIYGLPGDTVSDLEASFDWLSDLEPPEIHCHPLIVLPGSIFYERASEYGLNFEQWPPHRVLSTDSISPDAMDRLRKFSRGVELLYGCATFTFRCAKGLANLRGSALIWDFVYWAEGIDLDLTGGAAVGAGAPSEAIFPILEEYILIKFGSLETDGREMLAALTFDLACYECFKRSYHNIPRQSASRVVQTQEEDFISFLLSLEGPLRLVSLPTRVADLVGPGSGPNIGQNEGMHRFIVHRHGHVKLDQELGKKVKDLSFVEEARRKQSRWNVDLPG